MDALTGHHHPHYLSARQETRYGMTSWTFQFKPFTGGEPEPSEPVGAWSDPALTRQDQLLLEAEYRAARIMWHQARFRAETARLLPGAAAAWLAYARERKALDALYQSLLETTDGLWRARTMQLLDHHERVLAAAGAWQEIDLVLTGLEDRHLRQVGEGNELTVADVAREHGIDTREWMVGESYRGTYQPALVPLVRHAIDAQRKRLAEVARLTGDR
jgi:hypothetical protein